MSKGENHRESPLQAIILDLDGVVADTEDLHRQAYNLAFEEAGLPVQWSYADYRARLTQSAGSKLNTVIVSTEPGAEEKRKLVYARKRFHYLELLTKGHLPPRPGIIRLVDEALDAEVLLAVASTCAKEGALAILAQCLGTERVKRFSSIRAGDDALQRKPAPDIYLLVLNDLALAGRHCLAIEDTVHGVESAKKAGLWTLVTPSQYTVGDDFHEADLVVADLDTGKITLDSLRKLIAGRT